MKELPLFTVDEGALGWRHLPLKYLEQTSLRDCHWANRNWYVRASFVILVIIKPHCRRRKLRKSPSGNNQHTKESRLPTTIRTSVEPLNPLISHRRCTYIPWLNLNLKCSIVLLVKFGHGLTYKEVLKIGSCRDMPCRRSSRWNAILLPRVWNALMPCCFWSTSVGIYSNFWVNEIINNDDFNWTWDLFSMSLDDRREAQWE